ncbi:MAG: M56 family metallopeptidase [Planctomycetota bacterium]|jgi:D-alanyl-D-alanine endopeptidase (penicillin-binding protein 7)
MALDYLNIEITLDALGTTVIHFLWQGTLISLLAAVALSALRNAKPAARYAVACGSLALCFLVFASTLAIALDARLEQARMAAFDLSGIVPVTVPSVLTLPDTLAEFIAWAWVLGVVALTTRFALQRHAAHRLATRGTTTPTQDWLDAFEAIRSRLGIHASVRFMASTLAPAPMVVGCLRPIVLVPVSAFTSLTHDQLRAVLAHELAHIRRHDHLINTAQAVIESLLFFHPCIWWISSRIRIEREYCCDDIAIVRVANAKTFAEALVELETLRLTYQPAALAANGGSLMQRITRILGAPNTTRNRSPLWKSAAMMASVVALTGASLAYAGGDKHAHHPNAVDEIRALAASGAPDDAVRMLYDKLVLASDNNAKEMKQAKYEFKAGIKEALAAGEITDEQAEAKYKKFKSEMSAKNTQAFLMDVHAMTKGEAKLAYTRKTLDKKVAHGEMTQAHANEKLAYVAQNVNLREEFDYRAEKMAKKYKQKVADGKISEEEAHAKVVAYKKSLDARLAYHKTEMKLREQIAAGEISQDQAQAQLVALKSEWKVRHINTETDYSGIKKLINVAIENGQMTEADAKEIFTGLKKAKHKHTDHETSEPVAQTVESSSNGS